MFGGNVVYDSSNAQPLDFGAPIQNVAFDSDHNKLFIQFSDTAIGVYDYSSLVDLKQIKNVGQLSYTIP